MTTEKSNSSKLNISVPHIEGPKASQLETFYQSVESKKDTEEELSLFNDPHQHSAKKDDEVRKLQGELQSKEDVI